MSKQAKIAALEAKISALEVKVGAGSLKNKRVTVQDFPNGAVTLTFRADTGRVILEAKDNLTLQKQFWSIVGKASAKIGRFKVIFQGIETGYGRGTGEIGYTATIHIKYAETAGWSLQLSDDGWDVNG